MSPTTLIAILGGAAILAYLVWGAHERRRERKAHAVAETIASLGGDAIPTSLYPRLDPDRCISSGACVTACPEKHVIGLLRGRMSLVNPLACVGHGACAAACPVQAISLVFGTETRGVELPAVDPDFQTNLPGVYIVGELGGMGLIRNAVEQGRQAARHVIHHARPAPRDLLDAIVVGGGPAGISATLALLEAKRRVLLLEQDTFGGTIHHYPRKKVVMTGTVDIPIFGKVKRQTMSKEQLLELFGRIRANTNLPIAEGERVEGLARHPQGGWVVRSTGGERRAAHVILALGRRGSPRKLGVPGEELDKVSYRVLEPEVFRDQHVLVVGGGNAAADCVVALAEHGRCASVTLSYRRAELARLRAGAAEQVAGAIAAGSVRALMPTEVVSIGERDVTLKNGHGHMTIENDAVIVQIGGTAPAELLGKFGIMTVVKRGEA